MTYHMPAFYAPSLYTAMNELDNHDHSRFLTRTNHRVGRVANVGPYAAAENTNKAVVARGGCDSDDVAGGADAVLWG